MKTTRKTGALWFAKQLCGVHEQVCDNDGEYFFTKNGLISFKEALPLLRIKYARKLKEKRMRDKIFEYRRICKERCGQKPIDKDVSRILLKRQVELYKIVKNFI